MANWKTMNADQKKEYRARKAAEVKRLSKEIEQGWGELLENTDELVAFIRSLAWQHRYSVRNRALARTQYPGATFLAAFADWKKNGVKVKKGAKAIKVFAPITIRKYLDAKGNPVEKDSPHVEKIEKRTAFKLVPVFDVSQTDKGSEWMQIIANNIPECERAAAYWEFLTSYLAKRNIPVELTEGDETLGAHGLTRGFPGCVTNGIAQPGTMKITISKYENPTSRVAVLAHELGHAMLHYNKDTPKNISKSRKECEAEAVALIICEAFGIESKKHNISYISGWATVGNKKDYATVEAGLQTAMNIAWEVIEQARNYFQQDELQAA
ncbi:hypothetical protein ACU21_01515 [Actinobaculum suis]|uniref:ImmA/IrrE family metallo-endopeptidase n=1 Tax=Actinobaculum suis TaxID=1657 RepID=UPI0008087E37|nr:ImmA/IrrE family metallo-endopeptidase [Actinobaculum suis]OCA93152.1 hypothetical protein ACU21_01515 [Actinobaculum suis]